MNVLSLDLDFFMHGVVHDRADTLKNRPSGERITPWEPEEVEKFLVQTLNVTGPRPGRVVTSHHEVFYAWRDAISRKILSLPFFVCHVDAHSDMGSGGPSWTYLHSEFLELPLQERQHPQEGKWGLNFGSFMPFAIGNRWLSKIDFIASESWQDDIQRTLLPSEQIPWDGSFFKPPVSLEIELMHASADRLRQGLNMNFFEIRSPIGEPRIPYEILRHDGVSNRYSTENWDFIFLSHSPGYVPESADALLPVISKYINPF